MSRCDSPRLNEKQHLGKTPSVSSIPVHDEMPVHDRDEDPDSGYLHGRPLYLVAVGIVLAVFLCVLPPLSWY